MLNIPNGKRRVLLKIGSILLHAIGMTAAFAAAIAIVLALVLLL